ncbi:Avirulence (Avh) protein [Phytophthora megakarya]|uniref:RxLR effector protein n=1 Tax=Phytophthora megakarya TaxID=4795 RepID=A0A225VA81_9STRA|nr:Avirulence (Avh) protein [Phytophthora megakarya]
MRLMHMIALVAAVTFCPSNAALPTEDFKGMTNNGASPDMINLKDIEGGRLLRRVDYDNLDDDDDTEEERGFDIKNLASKLNPVAAAKKSAAQIAKAKEALKQAAEYQKMLDDANRLVRGG